MPKINQKIFRPKRSFVKSVPGAAVGLGPVEVGAPGPPVAIGGAVLTGRRDPIDVVARERALEGPVAVTPVHLEPMLYIHKSGPNLTASEFTSMYICTTPALL
jgi:hypothetical protein